MEEVETLIQRIRNGDKETFRFLVEHYQSPLYALAFARLRDPVQAREVVADTFVQAYLMLPQLAQPARFGTWVRSILHNYCLKALALRQRRSALSEEMHDPATLQDKALESRQLGATLSCALESLPAHLHEPVILHYFFDFSVADLAAWFEVPPGTIKRRLFDARQILKDHLGPPPASFHIQLTEEIVMKIAEKDLTGSALDYINMGESVFSNVDLSASRFEHVNINRVQFKHVGGGNGTPARDLSFEHCTLQHSSFRKVDLSESRFENTDFRNVELINCRIEGLKIKGVDIQVLLEKARQP